MDDASQIIETATKYYVVGGLHILISELCYDAPGSDDHREYVELYNPTNAALPIGGYKIFHCGDTNPFNKTEYQTFNLQNEKIDLAFLERSFMAGEGQPAFPTIQNYIQPGKIILIHIAPARTQVFKDFALKIKDKLPEIFVFEKIMENHSF